MSQAPGKTKRSIVWSDSMKDSASICKSKLSASKLSFKEQIKEKVKEWQDHFGQFISCPQTQNLRHIMEVLSEYSVPGDIPCRDRQKVQIESFIMDASSMGYSPEVLYIAGVPGIGKTLCVKNVVEKMIKNPQYSTQYGEGKVKYIYENGMRIKEPKDIFKSIYYHLTDRTKRLDAQKALYELNNYFEKGISNKQIKVPPSVLKILIIDQMDYLRTQEQQVIYTIVEWIRNKKSRLAIIGISNTIDLPESFSLKIASRFGNKRLIFPQYTSTQIGQILNQRLQQCKGVFQPQAIEYICKKMGGQHTDIRKCLQIMRQSVNKHVANERFKHRSSREVFVVNIPEYLIREVHKQLFYDSFVDSYPQFPECYKLVLVAMAKYFRQEKQAMAYSHLEHVLRAQMISINQLRSILYDLKDLGLISIKYTCLTHDNRIDKSFKIAKNIEEEFITLLIEVHKIMMASDADQRENKGTYNPLDRFTLK